MKSAFNVFELYLISEFSFMVFALVEAEISYLFLILLFLLEEPCTNVSI